MKTTAMKTFIKVNAVKLLIAFSVLSAIVNFVMYDEIQKQRIDIVNIKEQAKIDVAQIEGQLIALQIEKTELLNQRNIAVAKLENSFWFRFSKKFEEERLAFEQNLAKLQRESAANLKAMQETAAVYSNHQKVRARSIWERLTGASV